MKIKYGYCEGCGSIYRICNGCGWELCFCDIECGCIIEYKQLYNLI